MSEEKSLKQKKAEEKALSQKEWIYKGKILSLYKETLLMKDNSSYEREYVLHKGAVTIIPIDGEGRIILIKQYRRVTNSILLELPAGILEEGETPTNCAQRELQEEIGYKAEELISLGNFYLSPGFCNESLHLFLAKNLIESKLPHDEDEAIDIITLTPMQAWEKIKTNEIKDAKTINGILHYLWREKS